MKPVLYTIFVLLIVACGSQKPTLASDKAATLSDGKHAQILANEFAFLIKKTTTDKTYGYEPTNAIKVGGVSDGEGPINERRFLNALAGPNGELLSYVRLGSCCPQPSKNATFGDMAVLDNYKIWFEGRTDTLNLYINMYDSEELFIPVGFSTREF